MHVPRRTRISVTPGHEAATTPQNLPCSVTRWFTTFLKKKSEILERAANDEETSGESKYLPLKKREERRRKKKRTSAKEEERGRRRVKREDNREADTDAGKRQQLATGVLSGGGEGKRGLDTPKLRVISEWPRIGADNGSVGETRHISRPTFSDSLDAQMSVDARGASQRRKRWLERRSQRQSY